MNVIFIYFISVSFSITKPVVLSIGNQYYMISGLFSYKINNYALLSLFDILFLVYSPNFHIEDWL